MGVRSDPQHLDDFRPPYSGPEHLLLADRALPYPNRLKVLQAFMNLDEYQRAYGLLKFKLSKMFHTLYTKEKVFVSSLGIILWFMTVTLSFAAVGLFAMAMKHGHNDCDVVVTDILLCSIVVMEVFQDFSIYCIIARQRKTRPPTSSSVITMDVAQHNIISFVFRKKRPTKLMMLAAFIGCDDYVNMYWHVGVGQQGSCLSITTLVLRQLEDGWKEYIKDGASFKRFNGRRGQWTLSRKGHILQECQPCAVLLIHKSLQRLPFDESVLVWHIATDLCFYHQNSIAPSQESATTTKVISNYMANLLFLYPEMMMPGTKQDLFTMACYDLEAMLIYDRATSQRAKPSARGHSQGATS